MSDARLNQRNNNESSLKLQGLDIRGRELSSLIMMRGEEMKGILILINITVLEALMSELRERLRDLMKDHY